MFYNVSVSGTGSQLLKEQTMESNVPFRIPSPPLCVYVALKYLTKYTLVSPFVT